MKILKKIATVSLGSMIAAFGINYAIHAGFGGATLSILWDGLSRTFHMTMGQASFLIALLMIIFCFFYDRKQIGWGTVIYQVIYSAFVDVFEPLAVFTGSAACNFCLMIAGLAIVSLGCAIYAYADFGKGSYEALTFAFVSRKGWQIKYVRSTLDVICVVLGALLGGKVGLCTVATIVCSGFFLQAFLTRLQKWDPLRFRAA